MTSNPHPSLPDGHEGARDDIFVFVFNWFNERDPYEVRRCLDAYDARKAAGADHA